jgi:parallel beta-helix repeat protein
MVLTRRLGLPNPGLLAVLACVSLAVSAISPSVSAQTGIVPRFREAAFTLRENRTYDFGSRVVRCRPGQQVGIAAESSGNLVVTNVAIEGCDIGIVSAGHAAKVFDIDIRDTMVCMLITGNNGTISNNKASQCGYGIVVSGHDNAIRDNEVSDNAADGILISGDANVVSGNQALRNRGTGIRVVRMVPMIAEGTFLPWIQDLATGNFLQANHAENNNVDLEEFGDCAEGLHNSWADNLFATKRPDCIR